MMFAEGCWVRSWSVAAAPSGEPGERPMRTRSAGLTVNAAESANRSVTTATSTAVGMFFASLARSWQIPGRASQINTLRTATQTGSLVTDRVTSLASPAGDPHRSEPGSHVAPRTRLSRGRGVDSISSAVTFPFTVLFTATPDPAARGSRLSVSGSGPAGNGSAAVSARSMSLRRPCRRDRTCSLLITALSRNSTTHNNPSELRSS